MTALLKDTIKVNDIIKLPNGIRAAALRVTKYRMDTYLEYIDENGTKGARYLRDDAATKEVTKARKSKKLTALFEQFLYTERFRGITRLLNVKHGSDPEIFVVNKDTKEVIPAFNFLGGKDKPTLVESIGGVAAYGKNNPLFWDGFQAEFNTSAEQCLSWVCDSTYNGLMTLIREARKHDPKAKLTIQSTIDVPIDMLMEAKKEHVEFGCMPSFNAYGHEGLKVEGRQVPFRSAGGHIHFGVKDYLKKGRAEKYVKALDKILGVACVALFAKYDDPRRRELYGLAGEYRLPPHGLEYRTLSNAWLTHPLIMNMVFELGRKVVALAENDLEKYWIATEEETIDAINNCDVKTAQSILKRNKIMLKNILYSFAYTDEKAADLYKIFYHGMDSIISDTDDVEGNWKTGYASHCEGEGHTIGKMQYLAKYKTLRKMEEE